ncbi:family 16 glycoside hydrolase [Bosea thiooxidans]
MTSIINSIQDMMVTPDAQNATIDLASVFSGTGLTYTVQVAEETVVDPTIVDGKLVLDFGELGFSDIKITATDAQGQAVSDVFRVRVAGENAYTIAVFPDTQDYTSNPSLNHIFGDMTQWLVDNKDSHNIQFMIHVGDITQNNLSYQWDIAEAALRKLDGKIPYSLLPGNHDQANGGSAADHSSVYLDERFSPDKQTATNPDNFGGAYDQETGSARNTYNTFTAPDGTKWLVLSMEFGPRDDVIRWAGDVIEAHLDHRVIVASHSLTSFAGRQDPLAAPLYDEGAGYDYGMGRDPQGANDGETIYRELLAKYPNISMTFSGHIFGDGAETDVSYSQYGNPVYQFLVNYQNGISREITGNGNPALGNNGGNGAIRLVVVDPDNNTVSTETYFTEFDDYLDGYRVKPELDRDGLTGEYRGHQETFTDVDFGAPELYAMAKAGDDLQATAATGQDKASVHLDASKSLNPKSEALTYSWTDKNGDVVATGANPTVNLGLGKHELTLTVTDPAGVKTTDQVVVIVEGDATLLVETFNDGDAQGWTRPGQVATVSTGTTADFGIPGLPGSEPPTPATDDYAYVPKANASQGLKLVAGFDLPEGKTTLASYSVVFDLYVPSAGAGNYTGLLQIDGGATNADAELFLKKSGSAAGIGTLQNYQGTFSFDAWRRVAVTFTQNSDGSVTIGKYIDGTLAGSQIVDAGAAARYQLDPAKGLTLLADDDGETSNAYISSVLVTDHVFTPAEVAAMGGAKAGGILNEAPSENSVQFDFNAGNAAPSFGEGTLAPQGGQQVTYDSAQDFPIPALPVPAVAGSDEDAAVTFIPKLANSQALILTPAQPLPTGVYVVSSYTMAFDILVPGSGASGYTALFQTNAANADDADLFIKNNNNGTGGIGIGGVYPGAFHYDQWQRVVIRVVDTGDSVTISKFIDGVLVGSQSMDDDRYAIDLAKGVLLFTDEDGETSNLYVSSFLFSDKVYTDQEIADLGGVTVGGIVDEQPTEYSVQIDFSQPGMADEWGNASVVAGQVGSSGVGNFLVKGTVASRPEEIDSMPAPEGALYDQSDAAGNMLVWGASEAKNWSDYVYEIGLTSMDNDGIGVVFYYQDEKNYYRFSLNGETNRRELVKVKDGVQTVLASTVGGLQFNVELDLKIAVSDGRIDIFLGDRSVFDGPVLDETNPLTHGTIGVYSSEQRSSIFDDVVVTRMDLTAHAGENERAYDVDGDGKANVTLDAGSSFGRSAITSYVWTDKDGNVVATGKSPAVELDAGLHQLTLTVTDANGKTATDRVDVEIVDRSKILVAEDFSSAASLSKWTIVDEGEFGGVGPDGKSSEWHITADGKLIQTSDLQSRELTWNGASNPDVWQDGWSPLGDGVNVLRLGTYALYNDPAALAWDDYAIEATFQTPDNDGLGFLFHYTDAKNYYKLELDAEGTLDRSPSNGAGSIFNLIRMRNGVEEILAQVPGKYEPGLATQLRVEIVGNRIQAWLGGEPLFAYAIEDHGHERGTFGLYSWGNQGLTFDNVRVTDLSPTSGGENPVATEFDDELTGTAGDDVIAALAGDDIVRGGASNDVIDGGADDDELFGEAGNDALKGGDGDDLLDGGEGDDVLQGGAGDDSLDGGGGTDTADYSADSAGIVVDLAAGTAEGDAIGSDELTSIETVIAGSGDDVLTGDAGNNRLNGGAGRDTLVLAAATGAIALDLMAGTVSAAGLGTDSFSGIEAFQLGEGDDTVTLIAGAAAVAIDGGAGQDRLVLTGAGTLGALTDVEAVSLQGNWTLTDEGYDASFQDGVQTLTLDGALLADGHFAGTISGLAEEDRIELSGLAATQATLGEGNLLTITGGANGPVTLQLDPAADFTGMAFTLADNGHGGSYLSYGPANAGDDVLTGGNGDDIFDGGAGNDTLKGGAGDDTLKGGSGDDIVDGGSGDDVVDGGTGNDTIKAGSGDDTVDGDAGDDVIDAGSGDDLISAGAGNDSVDAGSGDDRIAGGAGDDVLTGGSGHDAFVFAAGFGKDVISDFKTTGTSSDVLEFSTDVFADAAAALAAAHQDGSDVVFTIDADTTLTLKNVQLASLNDFHFV